MTMNMFASASALSDGDLLARLHLLAGRVRQASAELVAHLGVLYHRPSVYAALGYGSLFAYCTEALGLSEDAACNRIDVAKACARFPGILDLLASGSMTLTSVRVVARYLTDENHRDVLERAKGRTGPQISELIAEIAPRPDVKSTMRKLPGSSTSAEPAPPTMVGDMFGPSSADAPTTAAPSPRPRLTVPARPTRSIVKPTSPDRYRVQFTIGGATRNKLLRLQALLRREVPTGDPAVIVDRALTVLLARVEKEKLGAASKPRPKRPIRPETDSGAAVTKTKTLSRVIPREVKRAVWRRDDGQCAFVSAEGRRCTQRTFLEFHHVQPFAHDGPSTADNIALRCRCHNQYEADLVFGSRHRSREWEEREHLSIRTPPRVPSGH
jgi:hypothetical protein